MVCLLFVFFVSDSVGYFFFSSRRRHTRSYGDWSSDVCSSDLPLAGEEPVVAAPGRPAQAAGGQRHRALDVVPGIGVAIGPADRPGWLLDGRDALTGGQG